MQKIPTLFKRDPDDMRKLLRVVNPGCEWVLAGEGTPTRKYDGTCCMLDADGEWWARREVKPGKTAPANFQPVETDENTGKTVGWEPMEQSAFAKWHTEAAAYLTVERASQGFLLDGTYELCGPKINGNPERYERHVLIRHEDAEVIDLERWSFPMTEFYAYGAFEMLLVAILPPNYEGIVWHHPDGQMCKLKKRDFLAG